MQRVDLLLVELGLAPSRTAAQALIAAGRVSVSFTAPDTLSEFRIMAVAAEGAALASDRLWRGVAA